MRVRVLLILVSLSAAMVLQRGGIAQDSQETRPAPRAGTSAFAPVDVGTGYPPFDDPVVWDDPIDLPEPPLPWPDFDEDPYDDIPEVPPEPIPFPDLPPDTKGVHLMEDDDDYPIFNINNKAVGTRAAASSSSTIPVAIALSGAVPLFLPAATDSFATLRIAIRTPATAGSAPPPPTTNPGFGQASQPEAIGDLNGDGVEDVVRLSRKAVWVSLGKPSGGFGAATSYSLGATGTTVRIADVNGDGKRDLIVGAGSLYLLLNNGDGTFRAAVSLPGVSDVQSIAVADFNADGKRDLAVTNITASTVSIFLGNGDGTFQAPASYPTGQFPGSMLAIDENHDGRPDIVTFSATQGTISTLLNRGNGTFGPAVNTATTFANQSGFLTFADLNRDGTPDLVMALFNRNSVALMLGKGDGTFLAPREYAAGTNPVSVAVLPVGAGYAIFTVDELTHRPLVFYGEGGRLAAKRIHQLATPRSKFQGIALADLNGDGQLDVAVSDSTTGNVMVSLSRNGVLQPFSSYAVGPGAAALQTGDLNGDKKPDIAVATATGIAVLLNKGDGTFSQPQSYAAGQNVSALVLSDFNRDGKLDAAVAVKGDLSTAAGGGLRIFLGRGDGTFQSPTITAAGQFQPVALAAADLNGDGVPDLLVASHSSQDFKQGAMIELIGRGDGTFQNAVTLTGGPTGAAPLNVLAADVNGDGRQDALFTVVTPDFNYRIVVLLSNGDGTFRAAPVVNTGPGSGQALAAVDLNGDGALDLLNPQCCGLADATYLLGNGDGTFQPEAHATSGPDPYAAVASTVNGKPLIAVAGNQGTILFMGGLATNPDASPSAPTISAVVNSASNLPGAIAPGEIVLVYGTGMGPGGSPVTAQPDPATGGIATVLAGVQILFDRKPAPLVYVSNTQSSAIVPYGVSGQATTQVQVSANGVLSSALSMPVTPAAPGLYSLNQAGTGPGVVFNQDGTLNSVTNPATPGSIIVFFGTGQGQTTPPGVDGQFVTAAAPPVLPVAVSIGGVPLNANDILYDSGVPGLVQGLLQMNVRIPANTPSGNQSIVLTVGVAKSQANFTVAIR